MDEHAANSVHDLNMPPMDKLIYPEELIQKGVLVIVEGGLHVNHNKIIGSFNNSKINGNTAIQSSNVTQTQNIGSDDGYNKAFEQLNLLIKKLDDEEKREQAEMNSELLREAIESEDETKSGKFLKFLVGALGTVQPLISIAQLAGIPLPNIPNP